MALVSYFRSYHYLHVVIIFSGQLKRMKLSKMVCYWYRILQKRVNFFLRYYSVLKQ
jgi:hypothetical protein